MLIVQCAAVLITLARALVLVHSQTDATEPLTADSTTTDSSTDVTEPLTTLNAIVSPTTEQATTQFDGTTVATDELATSSNASYVESTAAMTELEVTLGDNNVSSSLLSNWFVLSTTWKIVIIVGGFTVLTALPLVIIMILIVALGCMCKKYKRLKNRLITPTEIVASNNYSREMTTAMEDGVTLSNIKFLDIDIDTGDNVAYGQMTRVVEGRDNTADNMTIQNADPYMRSNETTNDNVVTVEGNTAGSTEHDGMGAEVKGHDDGATAESNGDSETECGSYVFNDLYESIQTVDN